MIVVDDTVSVATANTIKGYTSQTITATITDGAVAATLAAITNVDANDVITFTTDDTTVDATDLTDLDALVDNGTYTTVTEITEDSGNLTANTAVEVTDALAVLGGGTQTTDVTITGALTTAQIGAIEAATDGTITTDTITWVEGAEENITTLLSSLTDLDVVAIDAADGQDQAFTLTAADVLDLVGDGGTLALTADVTDTVLLDGTDAWVKTDNDGSPDFYFHAGSNVTLTVTDTVVVSDADGIIVA